MSRFNLFDNQEEELINLTPLIDVLFVILVFFILAAPLLKLEHVKLAKATENVEPISTNSHPVQIHVLKDNSILLNKEKTPNTLLPEKLEILHKLFPNSSVELYHDKQATFGTYQIIKGLVEQAGFEELDLILSND